jgi:hypothetical protein
VPAITGEVPPSSRSRRPFRVPGPRRRLAAIAAAGVTGAALVAGAVTASAAPAAPAPSRVITLTSSTSSAAGHLTVRFRYQPERAGKIKALPVSYAGGTGLKLRHPVLIVTLRPVLGSPFLQVRKQVVAVPVFTLILRIRDARDFSGTFRLPPRPFGRVSWVSRRHRVPGPLAQVLAVTLASLSRPKHPPVVIQAPVGMQVGILLGPVFP